MGDIQSILQTCWLGAETKNVAAEDWMATLSQDLLQARANLQRAQERQKQYADKKRRPLELKTGDEVLLAMKYLNIAGVGPSHKFGLAVHWPVQSAGMLFNSLQVGAS